MVRPNRSVEDLGSGMSIDLLGLPQLPEKAGQWIGINFRHKFANIIAGGDSRILMPFHVRRLPIESPFVG